MLITEQDIRQMVGECISLIVEGQTKIDNFDFVAQHIAKFDNSDMVYPVQITRRWKDNDTDYAGREAGRRKGIYHGGAWYLKHWIVRSSQELLNLKPEIIKWCEDNNARAYITINSRSYDQTSSYINSQKQKYGRGYKPRYEIISWMEAKSGPNWKDSRPKVLLDIDSTNKYIWKAVKDMIADYKIETDGEYETPSGGLHIILSNKNQPEMKAFKENLKIFDGGKDMGRLATVHPNEDAKVILYSNVKTKGY